MTHGDERGCGTAIRLFSYAADRNRTSYALVYVTPDKLLDRVNSEALLGKPISKLTNKVSEGSTIIIEKGSVLDPSVVLSTVGKHSFVVSQHSDPAQFGHNLNRIQNVRADERLSFVDFSPRTEEAVKSMEGFTTDIGTWKSSTEKIANALKSVRGQSVLVEPRSLESLIKRLRDPHGAVVVI